MKEMEIHERPIKVLLADDDVMQNMLMSDALNMEPDIVCCGQVGNGYDALEAIRTQRPDVIILDLIMPKMDGVDLMRSMRDKGVPKYPHILVLSASEDVHLTSEAARLGADHFFMKPYSCELMVDNVRMTRNQVPRALLPTLDRLVPRMLTYMGAPTNSLGFDYTCRAMLIVLSHDGACSMCKDIYRPIALDRGTTEECVEKAIRKMIECIFQENSALLNIMLQMSNQQGRQHLSNGRFLTLAAQVIREEKFQRRLAKKCQIE